LPGPTIPNRLFALAGQSGGDTDQPPHGVKIYRGIPTIFDRLDSALAGRPKKDRWGYFYHDLPMLALLEQHTAELLPGASRRIRKIGEFYKRAQAGTLPAVSWLDPDFADLGNSNDDHPPHSDLYDGQLLVTKVYHALVDGANRLFDRTLLIVTYDEHGGFFDHVPPPLSGDQPPFDRVGMRVPALVISPWVPAGHVDSTVRSHATILKTILNRFAPGLALTARITRSPDLGGLLSLPAPRPAQRIVIPQRPVVMAPRDFRAPSAPDAFFSAFREELKRQGASIPRPRTARPATAAARVVPLPRQAAASARRPGAGRPKSRVPARAKRPLKTAKLPRGRRAGRTPRPHGSPSRRTNRRRRS